MKKETIIKKKNARQPRMKSKGQVEAEISNAMLAFEKEHMGRGPVDVRSHIVEDMVLIRLKDVLTPAERNLAQDDYGIHLIKQVRAKLLENSSQMLADVIAGITGGGVLSFHTDISTKEGERVIVITFEQNLEKQLSVR